MTYLPNKMSKALNAAKNNDPLFQWDRLDISSLDDVLTGVIFCLYKNTNTCLYCLPYLQREDIQPHVSDKLDFLFSNLKFPSSIQKDLLKEEYYMLIMIPNNNETKTNIFKV